MSILLMKRRKQHAAPGFDLLPDEIIIHILSRLNLKQAISTSAISRRWRTLWRFTSGSLNFDYRVARGLIQGTGYEKWVNRILELHQGQSIERFSACVSPFLSRYASIDNWITLAIEKEVKHFELDLSGRRISDGTYTLHLDKFLFILKEARPRNDDYCSLISLRLLNVDVNDELIEYLVSNCPKLEYLLVKSSRHVENLLVVSSSIKSLEIVSCSVMKSLRVFSPSLKFLKIYKCNALIYVDVFAENLVSLIYHGPKINLELESACILSNLRIGGDFCGKVLSVPGKLCSSPHLKNIQLHVSNKVLQRVPYLWDCPLVSHPFISITRLELHIEAYVGDDLLLFAMLVRSCHFMCELVVKLLYLQPFPKKDTFCNVSDMYSSWERAFRRFDINYAFHKHFNLKVVKIINFAACEKDFELAWTLLYVCGTLEKILIRPIKTSISLSKARVRARKLKKILLPGSKLMIF